MFETTQFKSVNTPALYIPPAILSASSPFCTLRFSSVTMASAPIVTTLNLPSPSSFIPLSGPTIFISLSISSGAASAMVSLPMAAASKLILSPACAVSITLRRVPLPLLSAALVTVCSSAPSQPANWEKLLKPDMVNLPHTPSVFRLTMVPPRSSMLVHGPLASGLFIRIKFSHCDCVRPSPLKSRTMVYVPGLLFEEEIVKYIAFGARPPGMEP